MKYSVAILATFATISASVLAQLVELTAIEMSSIKGGEYLMGSPASEFERQKDETQHKVRINDFMLARHELSQKLYREVMGNNPSAHQGDELPVENISWFDAIRFCNALSHKNGLEPAYEINQLPSGDIHVTWNKTANGFRLPTEAEWEFAARAGSSTPFNTGENISANQANYYGTYPYRDRPSELYRGETIAIGSFRPNVWELYDMHGNVWEWCWDRYGAYQQDNESINPTGAEIGQFRVNRGGGFNDFGKHLRSAYRAAHNPNNKTFNIGMRLARNVD